jgi:hypothetical protein
VLDRALAELRSGGRHDSAGHFSLDLNKSLQKLSQFQLVQPLFYVNFLVAAAYSKGLSFIQFQVGPGDVIACFDGPPFSAYELADLFYALFETPSGPSARASHNLAFALNVTRQLGAKFMVFDSCSPKGGTRLQQADYARRGPHAAALDYEFLGYQRELVTLGRSEVASLTREGERALGLGYTENVQSAALVFGLFESLQRLVQ